MPDVLLQEIRPACSAELEELDRVVRIDVLADDDDADVGRLVTEERCSADSFVRVRRRHADVGDDDIGPFTLDGLHERRVVGAVLDYLDLAFLVEDLPDSLPYEVAVFGDYEAVHGGWGRGCAHFTLTFPSTMVP